MLTNNFNELSNDDLVYLRGMFNTKAEDLEAKIASDQVKLENRVARTEADNAAIASIEAQISTAQNLLAIAETNGTEEDVGGAQEILASFENQYDAKIAELNGMTPRQVEAKIAEINAMDVEMELYASLVTQLDVMIAA